MLATSAAGRSRASATSRQLIALAAMLAIYVLAAAAYIVLPGGALDLTSLPATMQAKATINLPVWQIVLGNAVLILVVYGLLGLAGYWLSQRASLPGIYRSDAGRHNWFVRPLGIGAAAGLVLVAFDFAARRIGGYAGFPHPAFPASIMASLSAAIGEEIVCRLFVLSLWSVILTWLFRRLLPGRHTRPVALWMANIIAALVFAATHLPGIMMIAGVSTPAALPPFMIAELVLLNGFVGILAGRACMRDGLVAASGIHFWTDIVWHVVYGTLV